MLTSEITQKKLQDFINQYAKNRQRAISVNFRSILSSYRLTDRLTHFIHPYPAKLLTHIPFFFLQNDLLSKPQDNVLDVFAGSGTVLLESIVAGRHAYGVDSNPLARLISKVKTTALHPNKLKETANTLLQNIPRKSSIQTPDVHNINYWYYPHIVEKLKRIRETILSIQNDLVQDFFLICFSKLSRDVSLANPRLSVPVRLKEGIYPEEHFLYEQTEARKRSLKRTNVVDEFVKIIDTNIERMAELWSLRKTLGKTTMIASDARNLKIQNCRESKYLGLEDNSMQLVITSPPYPGAQKYIRSSFLNIGWLGLESSTNLRFLKAETIGREELCYHEYCELLKTGVSSADRQLSRLFQLSKVRASIAAVYLVEMREVIAEIVRVLKPGGYLVLVAANNEICKTVFQTQDFLREICLQYGLKERLRLIDDIKSRGLMTKRNKTAGVISREWVHLFEK
jgi:DNA modification methylase